MARPLQSYNFILILTEYHLTALKIRKWPAKSTNLNPLEFYFRNIKKVTYKNKVTT